jgi:tetratricopeptide (TPR) repeat protein
MSFRRYGMSFALSCVLGISALATETKLTQESLDSAVATYNKGDFAGAYKKFSELYELKTDEPIVNFYLGRCATELKLYDEALLAFERVVMADPAHARSRMEMARIYMEEGSLDNAEVELRNTLEYNLPENIKTQVNTLLSAIEKSRKKNSLDLIVIAGILLDTNVRNASPYLNTSDVGQKYDYSVNETVVANHSYLIDKNLKWQNTAVMYGQQYRQALDSNILYLQIGSGLVYTAPSYQLSVTPTLENLKYGMVHESGGIGKLFLQDRMQDTMNGIGINEKLSTALFGLSLEQTLGLKKQYYNNNSMLDASVLDGSLTARKDLGNSRSIGLTASLSKSIGTHNAIYDNRSPLANYFSKSIKLDINTPVMDVFNLGLNATIKKQDYENAPSVRDDNARSDYQKSFGLSASKQLGKTMMLGTSFNRIYNSSNYDTNKYQKSTFGITLTKVFNIL